jgi:hypothetical protein
MTDSPEAIYRSMVEAFNEGAAAGWSIGQVICRQVGELAQYAAVAYMPDGSKTYLDGVGMAFGDSFDALRELFAQPGKGTWFTATIKFTSDGRLSGDFDYDNEPEWGLKVSPGHYVEEWELYPRDAAHTPDWLAARLAEAAK